MYSQSFRHLLESSYGCFAVTVARNGKLSLPVENPVMFGISYTSPKLTKKDITIFGYIYKSKIVMFIKIA